MDEGYYSIKTGAERLILKTKSFRAEKGSVLHGGIFNKELASSFAAAIFASGVPAFFALYYGKIGPVHFITAAAIFAVVFPLCRVFVFRDHCLETIFDGKAGTVSITLISTFRKRIVGKPLESVSDIRINHVRIGPENPDGAAVVEKIALQHGTVIPGLGKTKEFYNIDLVFNGKHYTVLTTESESDARKVVERLKHYI